jgi:hypothetical protein
MGFSLPALLIGILSFVTFGSVAQAQSYTEEMQHLIKALQDSRFSTRELEAFQDPFKGKVVFRLPEDRAPWAGNYFPMDEGGIANRWQQPQGFQLTEKEWTQPTREEIFKLSPAKIDMLSPSEKYDLMKGDYEFSVTRHELKARGPLREIPVQAWEGFCNGVRCAGINLKEPQRSIVIENPDGLKITFHSADLKALAGASYFYVEKYAQLGSPSKAKARAEAPPNAAVFDVALRFYLAEKQKAFVIDSHLGAEIWNESIIGFERKLSEPLALTAEEQARLPWAVRKIIVHVKLETLAEIDIANSNRNTKPQVAAGDLNKEIKIAYTLYLDGAGKAFDGAWLKSSGTRGVDFAWFGVGKGTDGAQKMGNPFLKFSEVKDLFRRASNMSCKKVFLF